MAKNPFGDNPIEKINPFGDTPINQTSPFETKKEDGVGFGTNLYRTIVGAARDVAAGTLDAIAFKEKFSPIEISRAFAKAKASGDLSVSNVLSTALEQDNPLNIVAKSIPKIEEPDYFGGSLVRDLTGFAIPGTLAQKAFAPVQAVTTGQKLLKGAAIGTAAEQLAFSPYEQRISNLIQDYPELQNPITEYLQADPNDNEAEARLKMAVEGSAIGIPFDALLRVISKGFSKTKPSQTNTETPQPIIDEPTPKVEPSVDEAIENNIVDFITNNKTLPKSKAKNTYTSTIAKELGLELKDVRNAIERLRTKKVLGFGFNGENKLFDDLSEQYKKQNLESLVRNKLPEPPSDLYATDNIDADGFLINTPKRNIDYDTWKSLSKEEKDVLIPEIAKNRGFDDDELFEILDDNIIPNFSKKEFRELVPSKYGINENGVITNPETLKIELPKSYKEEIELNYIKVGDRYLVSEMSRKPSVDSDIFLNSIDEVKDYLINKSLQKYKNPLDYKSDTWNNNIRPKVLNKLQQQTSNKDVQATTKQEKRPRSTTLPSILKRPLKPKKIKTARSLVFGVPKNDPNFEEIISAIGYDVNQVPATRTSRPLYRADGSPDSDYLDLLVEQFDELGFGAGRGGAAETRGIGVTKFDKEDVLEILEQDLVLPEFEEINLQYQGKLQRYEEVTSALNRAGIDPNSLRGKTDEEVLDIVSQINEAEDLTGARVSDSFAAQFQDQPPVSAYADELAAEELKISSRFIEEVDATPPDFAGNINLNKIDEPDKIKNVINEIAENNDMFMEARRGVVKFGSNGEELRALAKETGLTEDQLINRRKGTAFNAETAYAARVLNTESAANLVKLAKKANSVDASAEDLMAFERAANRHVAIQEQISGITAEAGRALRQFRETVSTTETLRVRAIKDYIQNKGGKEKIEEMATFISNLETPEQIAKFTKDAFKPRFKDKLQELWINSLLSSPSTHIVNVFSNAIVAATRMPEYAVASVLGATRKGSDKVSFSEVGGRIYGSIYGFLDGMRAFKNALIDPQSVDDPLTKLELQRQNSISGIKGEIVRLPGRFLTAEDQLFKSVGYRQELWGQAIRKAKSEGKGLKRAFEIMDDPAKNFPDIHLKAQDTARVQTFTNPLGPTGQAVQTIINNHPWSRYIAPFVRTPVNIVKYALKRTPLGLFAKSYKEAIKKGGAEADLARARLLVGSTAMASISYLANDGLITGRGPSDFREKAILRETGWQPYSIKVGDTYYAYNRFEPIGILFGLAADWTDIYKYADKKFTEDSAPEFEELATMLAASFTENITNKTFLTGISDAINVMFNPDRYGDKAIQRFLSSFIPTASYYVRKNNDPLIRDAQSVMDSFYNRIPGLSEELPAKRNVFGETIEFQKGAAPQFLGRLGETFSPVATSKIQNDPVFNELVRLKITPSIPRRDIGGVELDSKQYESLMSEMINLQTKAKLESMIQTDEYKRLLDSQKIEFIKDIIRTDQATAREITQIKYPEIFTQQMQQLMDELK